MTLQIGHFFSETVLTSGTIASFECGGAAASIV
jgi:hypothetical protein